MGVPVLEVGVVVWMVVRLILTLLGGEVVSVTGSALILARRTPTLLN